jgi:hypothetical protein
VSGKESESRKERQKEKKRKRGRVWWSNNYAGPGTFSKLGQKEGILSIARSRLSTENCSFPIAQRHRLSTEQTKSPAWGLPVECGRPEHVTRYAADASSWLRLCADKRAAAATRKSIRLGHRRAASRFYIGEPVVDYSLGWEIKSERLIRI